MRHDFTNNGFNTNDAYDGREAGRGYGPGFGGRG